MKDFAWALSRIAGIGGRVVVDETGLTGNYDFDMRFTVASDGATPGGSEDLSIFSAIQNRLGLKLEWRVEPVQFIVIESVERPSDN